MPDAAAVLEIAERLECVARRGLTKRELLVVYAIADGRACRAEDLVGLYGGKRATWSHVLNKMGGRRFVERARHGFYWLPKAVLTKEAAASRPGGESLVTPPRRLRDQRLRHLLVDGATIADMATVLKVSRQAVSLMLGRAVAAGIVKRDESGRAVVFRLAELPPSAGENQGEQRAA